MSSEPKISNLPFMRFRGVFLLLSLIIVGLSIAEWFVTGDEKFGVDFVGGAEVVVQFNEKMTIGTIRKTMNEAGFTDAIVQEFKELGQSTGEYSIRLKAVSGSDTPRKVTDALDSIEGASYTLRKEDFVGPTIGAEIREAGITALVVALIGMLIYISLRFEWRFALGALGALVHDVTVATGIYILSGREISAAVLAALLTIVGYSLNDTIVVFDRVRENILKARKRSGASNVGMKLDDFLALVDRSINQTLSRTLLTSLTTLFVVTTLWLMGGGAVADLAFTLVIGVIIGTYSSIFIACPIVVALENAAAGKEAKKKAKRRSAATSSEENAASL